MVNIVVDIVEDVMKQDAQLNAVIQAIKELDAHEALVGIPEESAERKKGDAPSNALLLYWHTNGAPGANIPPRPVIEPAIEDSKEQIGEIIQQAAKLALDGNAAGAIQMLNKAGLAGQKAAFDWFTNPKNAWPPNADVTIHGSKPNKKGERFIKGKASKGSNNPKPLIDTGELRRAITYVVRPKND